MENALAPVRSGVGYQPPPSLEAPSDAGGHGASPSSKSWADPICRRGITRTWVGAAGLMSLKATTSSVSITMSAGMSPDEIEQNRQSEIVIVRLGRRDAQVGQAAREVVFSLMKEQGKQP